MIDILTLCAKIKLTTFIKLIKNMHYIFRLFIFLLSILPINLTAMDIHISAAHWPNYTEQDGKGIYLELISAVYPDDKLTFDISSFARAKRLFNQNKSDILVGVYMDDKNELKQVLYPKFHIDIDAPIIAIYNPLFNNITTKDDIQFKTVSWYEEYSFDKYLPNNITHYQFKDLDTAFSLLEKGRTDVVVDYGHNLKEKQLAIFKTITLTSNKQLFIVFKDNKKGHELSRQFEIAMPRLKSSGFLQELYGANYHLAKFR